MSMQKKRKAIFRMEGGVPLNGSVAVQGSKNALLPIMAASLLIPEECTLLNCPQISDLECMKHLLSGIGCYIEHQDTVVKIDASRITGIELPRSEMTKIRSSIILLGAILSRKREASVSYPGGCKLGERPIDLHLFALERLGVSFQRRKEYIYASCLELKGAEICFPFSSVGATENAILAAVLAKGDTLIHHAAKEPEIVYLCEFLNMAGAKIRGAGTDDIIISGVCRLHGITYQIPYDRIVAGTYLFAAAGTHGKITLYQAPIRDMEESLRVLQKMGAKMQVNDLQVVLDCSGEIHNIAEMQTLPYPGFATDLQSMLLTTGCVSKGTMRLQETVFDQRFAIVEELIRMGADVCCENDSVLIHGKEHLTGRNVIAKDLRGGAALVEAGLIAEGITTISDVQYIERGYEDIVRDYRCLGAKIEKLE